MMSAQGTDTWREARLGCATASRFADIIAAVKNGEAAARRNYRAQLVCERLTGIPQDQYVSDAMLFGTETEPVARLAYEAETGHVVTETGFIAHAALRAGCSPDGLIGADGGVEIKCPNTATHIETLLDGAMPMKHAPQVQGCMWITGRRWWDFVSFDPRLPDRLRLFVVRVPRDDAYIKRLAGEVNTFLLEVDDFERRLRALP